MTDTQGTIPTSGRGGCTAQLCYRGEIIHCDKWHRDPADFFDSSRHECNGVYWRDGETQRDRCTAVATYCGEELRCSFDAPERQHPSHHGAYSKQHGDISWSDEKRPQPSVMFEGLGRGHRYGSYQADAMMLAAATMQDAINRWEYLNSKARR